MGSSKLSDPSSTKYYNVKALSNTEANADMNLLAGHEWGKFSGAKQYKS